MTESRVGKMLSENTIKKVISFVLIILILLPMFDLSKIDATSAQTFGLTSFFLTLKQGFTLDDPLTIDFFESNFEL